MKFLRDGQGAAEQHIAKAICDGLQAGKRVVWLVSGGSNIAVQNAVMDLLQDHASRQLDNLTILPIDERYGKPDHQDSNIQQLREAGLKAEPAVLIDVLAHDLPFDQTVDFYNEATAAALASADIVIGQLGLGADGHIAGIKPDSPATKVDNSTVAGYNWSDYQRMTLMPAALRQITIAFLVAYGADKQQKLKELQTRALPFSKLPAVLLYDLPEVYVYNDQIESEG